jgi:hypothetical protein
MTPPPAVAKVFYYLTDVRAPETPAFCVVPGAQPPSRFGLSGTRVTVFGSQEMFAVMNPYGKYLSGPCYDNILKSRIASAGSQRYATLAEAHDALGDASTPAVKPFNPTLHISYTESLRKMYRVVHE